jgi:quinol monooxygenase YgiN
MTTLASTPKVAFTLHVKVTFDPKDRETFLKYFRPAFDAVKAEPECAYFVVGEDVQQPGTFRWTEGWTKDVNWFMAV